MVSYLSKLSFKMKIILMVIVVTFIGIMSTLLISYVSSKNSLMSMSKDQLNSIASISKTRASDFLRRTKTFTGLLGKDRLTEGLILAYESAFYGVGKSIGKDEVLNNSSFKKLDAVYKQKVEEQVNSYQIARYMLANIQGQIVFSSDFDDTGLMAGRSLTKGLYKDLNLAKCVKEALASKDDTVFYSDFEFNPNIKDAQAYFCVRTMAEFDHLSEGIKAGDRMGAVVVQINGPFLTKILSDRAGMGDTGQAYILGDDGYLRSDFFINSAVYNVKNVLEKKILIKNEILEKVKNKILEGQLELDNPNGKNVLTSFSSIDFEGHKWVIVAEKELKEILAPVNTFIRNIIIVSVIIIVLLVFVGIYFATNITKMIISSIETLTGLSTELYNDAEEINKNSNLISDTSDSQVKDLQSTVQAINEISSTIEQNTSNAKNSAEVSQSSLVTVETGRKVVTQMITSMNKINESNEDLMKGVENSNKKLSEIISLISEIENKTKIINDIVFQTKLLSFNASVESARAGEHGKGFAVVAEEVGNLASISGTSAQSIAELLQQSIERVNVIIQETQREIGQISKTASENVKEGQKIADECGTVFEKILVNVSNVSQMVNEISHASMEQNIGMTEINKAMNRLNAGSVQSTEAAQKSLDSAKELNNRSESIKELVDILNSTIHGKK